MNQLQQLESELHLPSPLQKIEAWSESNTQYFIKRDDLIDTYISGNKYRKLKGHLSYYINQKEKYTDGILTYGGAFSNHLYATASACHRLGIPLTAVVRGLEADNNNATLSHLLQCGSDLIKVSRTEYRLKDQGKTATSLIHSGNYIVVPEGGNNSLAHLGIKDLVDEIYETITPNYICVMSGTGATAEGILNQISGNETKLIICSAVRDDSVKQRILNNDLHNQVIWLDEIWGGFGKKKPDLINGMHAIIEEIKIPLEYVYTGRLMVHMKKLRLSNYFPSGSKVVLIHTGGLRVSNHLETTLG